jgi:GWxTD domain-containing protein
MTHRYDSVLYVILCFVILALAVRPVSVMGQVDVIDLDIEAISLMAQVPGSGSRVDIYTRVPFTELAFQPSPEGFVARYRIAGEIVEIGADGRRGNPVRSPVWDRTVNVPSFGETKDRTRFDYTTQTVLLRPGRYAVELSLQGEDGATAFVKETQIEVKGFEAPVSISDLLLLEEYDVESSQMLPSVSNRLASDQLGFSLMYEVYVRQPRSVRISRQVFLAPDGMTVGETPEDEMESTEVVFVDAETKFLEARRSQHIVTVPTNELRLGGYVVRVSIEDEDGNVFDVAEKSFTVDWMGLADHIMDVDEAIAQLQYIAKRKEIRRILEPESKSERLARFQDFWRKRDPSPGTRRNERMEEYYHRVSHANRRYGSLIDGWKTDRGQVVVLFGEPDFVESHPYNFNVEPYEIWFYYSIGRRFIFVDRTGLGDYQLLVPIWDERTRLR